MQLTDILSVKDRNYQASGNVAVLTLDIARAITKACKFVSKDTIRPQLTYLCFHIKYDTLTIVATDSIVMYISEPFNLGELKTFGDFKYLVSVPEARSIAKAIRSNKIMYLQTGTVNVSGIDARKGETTPALCICKAEYEIYVANNYMRAYPEYGKILPLPDQPKCVSIVNADKLYRVVIDCLNKYNYGGTKFSSVERSWDTPIWFNCFPDMLSVSIDSGKHSLYERRIKPFESNFPAECKAKPYNANIVAKLLKVLGGATEENIYIEDVNPNSAYASAIFALEGTQEKILLIPVDLFK